MWMNIIPFTMKSFQTKTNILRRGITAVTAIAALMFSTASCTKVDNELGDGMIPDDARMLLVSETITDLACYQGAADSVITDSWTYPLLGSMVSQMDGLTECSVVAQYSPGFISSTDSIWGDNPVIDSVKLEIDVATVYGDSTSTVTVSIYDMIENLPYTSDSVRLSSYPALQKVGSLIHSFDLTPSSQSITTYLPVDYAKRFLDTTGSVYNNDTLFHKKFKPLYFTTDPVTSKGSLIAMSPINSYMYIYYHNQNKPNPDTTYIAFTFRNSSDWYNDVFTVIRHNYDYADPLTGVNPAVIDSDQVQTSFFVTSLGGLTGKVVIDKAAIDRIKEKAKAMGYSSISVNNAYLTFPVARHNTPSFDYACSELGLYFDYNKAIPTDDYDLKLLGSSSFDGSLNRALEQYRMDVSSHIQALISGKSDKYTIEVTPTNSVDASPSGVQLAGTTTNGVKLSIAYTMIISPEEAK